MTQWAEDANVHSHRLRQTYWAKRVMAPMVEAQLPGLQEFWVLTDWPDYIRCTRQYPGANFCIHEGTLNPSDLTLGVWDTLLAEPQKI